MTCCENRVSANCETKPVTILPTTSAAKTRMKMRPGESGSSSTRLTIASKPALQAPLRTAAIAVTSIIRRHFVKTSRIKFIMWPSRLRCCERCFDFARQDLHIRFHKNSFMRARDDAHFQPGEREIAPAVLRIERAEEGLPARAQQRYPAAIRLRHVSGAGGQMHSPQFEFVLGELRGVDVFFEYETNVWLRAVGEQSARFAFHGTPFALNEIAAFARAESEKVDEPVRRIHGKTGIKRGSPPGHPFVIGVWRRAVDQEQQAHLFALVLEVTRHFVSDVTAETIAAQVIWSLALEGAKVLRVTHRHFLDSYDTIRFEGIWFEAVHGLVRAEMRRQI